MPVVQQQTQEERARIERAVGSEIATQLEGQLKFRNDTEISVYLRNLAQTIMEATPALRSGAVGVLVVQDRRELWRSFALPGNRIYLSAGMLKSLEFENEIAALLAMQFGHLLHGHAFHRLQQAFAEGADPGTGAPASALDGLVPLRTSGTRKVDYFGPAGIFTFPDEAVVMAATEAVGILYRAGYDPRGLSAVWQKLQRNPKHSPYDPATLEKLLQATRRAIAQNAPLRNPVVRSQSFLGIQKRIRKL